MLNEIEKIIGKERLSRVLEVLETLGKKIPENFVIENDSLVYLTGKQNQKNNYIVFNKDMISIVLEDGKHKYIWKNNVYEEGKIRERFIIDGSLTSSFLILPYATITSCIYLYNDIWSSPKIYSDISGVTIDSGENKQVFSIDDYFEIFTSYMKSKKESLYDNLENDPDTINMIIRVFENPLKRHVNDLKNNDQSWRFFHEKEEILSDYNKHIYDAEKKYSKDIIEAISRKVKSVQNAKEIRNGKIGELNKLQKKQVYVPKK